VLGIVLITRQDVASVLCTADDEDEEAAKSGPKEGNKAQ
jgi:hypothetical protein